MNDILTYPEDRRYDSAPGILFDGAVESLLNRIGLDNALNLLTCLLEAL
jgi:hypothetical protein